MPTYDEKFMQLHKALRAMSEVILEFHTGVSEATQNLELEMQNLDALMAPVEITAAMVLELRQRTGDGMIACKKALVHSDGNMIKAVDYLRNSGNISLTDSHWGR
jgi:hypothetical protein